MKNRATTAWNRRTVWGLPAILVFCLAVTVHAEDGGRTAADFLKIGLGARAAGMGEANTATSRGAEAAFWNPAGVVNLNSGGEAVLGHFAWYQDITIEHGALAFRLGDAVTLATSMAYVNYGAIDGYALDGTPTGEQLTAYDIAGALSAGVRLHNDISAGLSAKLIHQQLDGTSGQALAFDVGLKAAMGRLTVAATVLNLGRDIDFDGVKEPLPTAFRAGLAWSTWDGLMVTALDAEKPRAGAAMIRAGTELTFQDRYYLRGGLQFRQSTGSGTHGPGPSFGAGMKIGSADLSYAFSTGNRLVSDGLHRFSFTVQIGR